MWNVPSKEEEIVTITLQLPERLARQLTAPRQDLSRAALEWIALAAYRERKLSTEQARQLLGFATRDELDGFFKQHGVWLDYTLEDLDREGEITRGLMAKRRQELASGASVSKPGQGKDIR